MQIIYLSILLIYLFLNHHIILYHLKNTVGYIPALIPFLTVYFAMGTDNAEDLLV